METKSYQYGNTVVATTSIICYVISVLREGRSSFLDVDDWCDHSVSYPTIRPTQCQSRDSSDPAKE